MTQKSILNRLKATDWNLIQWPEQHLYASNQNKIHIPFHTCRTISGCYQTYSIKVYNHPRIVFLPHTFQFPHSFSIQNSKFPLRLLPSSSSPPPSKKAPKPFTPWCPPRVPLLFPPISLLSLSSLPLYPLHFLSQLSSTFSLLF